MNKNTLSMLMYKVICDYDFTNSNYFNTYSSVFNLISVNLHNTGTYCYNNKIKLHE